jgi:hypothetical protein
MITFLCAVASLRKSKNTLALLLATVGLAMLTGCGSGSGSGGASGTSGILKTGTVTPAQKSVVETAIVHMITSMSNQAPATVTEGVANYMKTRAEFTSSGVDETGCAWGVYKDGVPLIFINNFRPGPAGKAAPLPVPSPPAQTRAAYIPGTMNALIFQGFPAGYNSDGAQAVSTVASYANTKGYTNMATGATVQQLRSLPVAGIFYYISHGGGAGSTADPYSIWTSSPVGASDANDDDPDNAYDLAHGYLVHAIADIGARDANGNEIPYTNYCFTAGFVKQYMAFNKSALIYLDACNSNSIYSSSMKQAFMSKGAATYGGWSSTLYASVAYPTSEFLFDRMLGTNADGDYKVTPPQRPFDSTASLTDAMGNGLASFPGGVVSGQYAGPSALTFSGGPALLTPSISYLTVQERGQDSPTMGSPTLTINGEFGSTQGTVQVDGTNLTVNSWSDSQIVCVLPDATSVGGSGTVYAISKGMVKSNAVPLTIWYGTVTYTEADIPAPYLRTWTATQNVYFRGDVHAYRTTSGGDPNPQKSLFFRAAGGSACNWTLAWTYPNYTTASPLSGTAPYGVRSMGSSLSGWAFEGTIQPGGKTINIGWTIFGLTTTVTTKPPAPAPGGSAPSTMSVDPTVAATQTGLGSDHFPTYTHPIAASFDSDWILVMMDVAGKYPKAINSHLKWPNISPSHAPTADKGEDDNS